MRGNRHTYCVVARPLSWLPNVEDEGWFDDIFIRNNIPPAMLQ